MTAQGHGQAHNIKCQHEKSVVKNRQNTNTHLLKSILTVQSWQPETYHFHLDSAEGLLTSIFVMSLFFWIMLSCSMVALGYFFIHLSIPPEKPHKVIFILPSYTSQIFNSELVPLNSLCRQRDETGSFALRISWTVLGMTLWEEFILERPVSLSIESKISEHLHVIK